MAVVVEQTIPFESSSLDLQNPHRWNELFPLIRPTVHKVQTAKGQHILVDRALAKSKFVNIAAVGSLGSFSSKSLDDKHVTAIVTETAGTGVLTAQDIKHALQSVGAAEQQGVVVVRSGKRRKVDVHGPDVVEVEGQGELELDHMLHLLGHATDSCRASIDQTTELLKTFASDTTTSFSRFHTEKAGAKPAISHAEGSTAGFEDAKSAVEKDLKHVFQSQTARNGQITYSVHYSDINGLSRLENYILAKDIAEYLDAQNIAYRLSHSTLLDHKELGRGFAISVCAVPAAYLSAQEKPKPHVPSSAADGTGLSKVLSPTSAQMKFVDGEIRKRVKAGCDAVIEDEPMITEYDTIVGDGDCGYTLRDGAKQVLAFLEKKDLAHLPEVVGDLVQDLEVNMGGTSGALYCIFLTALAASLASESSIPKALQGALDQLLKYTRARLGDRTMMDALIPFVDALNSGSDASDAIAKAKDGVEGTKKMEAKLGRSTYLDEGATRGVPDPGAYGLWVLLKGMVEA